MHTMRRCANVASLSLSPPWLCSFHCGASMWRHSRFLSSSKFIGRKHSDEKKCLDSRHAPGAEGPTEASIRKESEVRKAVEEMSTAPTSPVKPADEAQKSAVEKPKKSEQQRQQIKGERRQSSRTHRNGSKTRKASSDAAKTNPGNGAVPVGKAPHSCGNDAALESPQPAASTSALSTHEESSFTDRTAVSRLFIVSDAVAFMFTTVPRDQHRVSSHLKKVDQSVISPASQAGDVADIGDECCSDAISGGRSKRDSIRGGKSKRRDQRSSVAKEYDVASRVLSEECANNTLYIHVRDMERLVPPPHLLSSSALTFKRFGKGSKKRQPNEKRSKKSRSSKTTAVGEATESPLAPLDRALALRLWQAAAMRKARESQKLNDVSLESHAITRVCLHDPETPDETVVHGCGSGKTVSDVLETLKKEHDDRWIDLLAADGAVEGMGSHASSDEGSSYPTMLSTPFMLKPLLSVIASCIPRSESLLGVRCDEDVFLRSLSSRHVRRAESIIRNTAVLEAAAKEDRHSCMDKKLSGRRVPPVPRFSTRVIVLIEHDDLHSQWSVNGGNTKRKSNSEGGAESIKQRQHRKPRVYCLIADGGEIL
uniref:WGS project CAEQ00000000 data, annotated contig 1577 n=1 Tax=Trypanosoma congolense (strain IL3000) TaxID=1068625 RepID=F9W772_TRYCI|nr:unnamed protein product [Trypanosoma congolense IL3000]